MTRDTMASAINMGIRRSAGKSPEAVADSILLAIEMAMELEESMKGAGLPASSKQPLPPGPVLDSEPMISPPPNPGAIQEDYAPVETEPIRHPVVPPLAPPKNLVTLATSDVDIDRAVREAPKPRVRSVFMRGRGAKIKLEDVMSWVVANFPGTIPVIPKGVEQQIVLNRKIYAVPCSGEGRTNEKESVAKIAYNHPKMDSTMEVGLGIRVGDVDEQGYPVVDDILARIKEQARELYKSRPPMIEGRAPSGPTLENAFRAVTAPKPVRTAMKFADADQPLMFPDAAPAK